MSQKQANMRYGWLAAEHARLHVVAGWPDSPRKSAIIRAIRSSLRDLLRVNGDFRFECVLCRADSVIEIFPKRWSASVSDQVAKAA
jgi:hypothetical protein